MPVGIITDLLSVAIGGFAGSFLGCHLSDELKAGLTNVFAFSSVAMGLTLIVKVHSLSVVILSLVLGTIVGSLLRLESLVEKLVHKTSSLIMGKNVPDEQYLQQFCGVAVLFCASGTGLFGALKEGFTGDGSILITKSILDFFTALIFAAILGRLITLIAIPQAIIYLGLFGISFVIAPVVTPEMLADFSAVGGVIALIAGLRIAGIKKDILIINMLPALAIIMPVSMLWSRLMD